MITALLAAVLLGEPARRESWLATLVAFGGVLIVLRPNFAEFGWPACFPLLSALGMSLLMIGNRKVAGSASPLAMQFLVAIMATPILIAVTAGCAQRDRTVCDCLAGLERHRALRAVA